MHAVLPLLANATLMFVAGGTVAAIVYSELWAVLWLITFGWPTALALFEYAGQRDE